AISFLSRILYGDTKNQTRTLLGGVLGLGYLFKTIFFPLSLVFIFLTVLLDFKRSSPMASKVKWAPSLVLPYLILVWPMLIGITLKYDRFTVGESGTYNYIWYVNKYPIFYPPNQEPPAGTLAAPKQIIFENPTVYAFANPDVVTWPFWYDPARHLGAI